MTDLEAQSQKLRTAASIWQGCAADTRKVAGDIAPALDQGDKFGVLAGSGGVSGHYNNWIRDMHTAAHDGVKCFGYLAAALRAIADTYDGVDSTVAQSMESLDRMI